MRRINTIDIIYVGVFVAHIAFSYAFAEKSNTVWWILPSLSCALLVIWFVQTIKANSYQSTLIQFISNRDSFSKELLHSTEGIGSVDLIGEVDNMGYYYNTIDKLLKKPLKCFPKLSSQESYRSYLKFKKEYPSHLSRTQGPFGEINSIISDIDKDIRKFCEDTNS